MKKWILAGAALLGLALFGAACAKKEAPKLETHSTTGVIKAFQSEGKVVAIQHEEFPGWMGAMTMGFELRDPKLASGMKVGDKVDFTLTLDESGPFVSAIAPSAKK